MAITLTKKQEEGLKIAKERYNNHESHTVVGGLAGTGKSVLVKFIIDSLHLQENQFVVGAFTGKAAQRLSQVGFPQAKTLHKIFYNTRKIGNNFIHIKKSHDEIGDIKLILIDEVSMVPDYMLKDIASLGIHTIMMGDPGQLPPVGKDNHILDNPHVFLTEIMRQSLDSPIVMLAHSIRNGDIITPFSNEGVIMVPKEEITIGMLNWADQVLCGKNDTRNGYNHIMREDHGWLTPLPQEGDKIIITKNNWEFFDDKSVFPLINGLVGTVDRSGLIDKNGEKMGRSMGKKIKLSNLDFTSEFDDLSYRNVKYDALPLISGENSYIINQFARGNNAINFLDYAYAITVHKAQGSEYQKVVGIEEHLRGTNHRRWLYTLVTRASEKLVLGYDSTSSLWGN